MTIFVDTSGWFAAIYRKDQHNAAAKRLLASSGLATSDHVVIETWMLVSSRLSKSAANAFVENILSGPTHIEVVGLDDIGKAEDIRRSFPDQGFSLVDRTSFVVMERLKLTRVISFDNDFVIYRYGPQRDRAFEVLR